jgi:hypothetical protein
MINISPGRALYSKAERDKFKSKMSGIRIPLMTVECVSEDIDNLE